MVADEALWSPLSRCTPPVPSRNVHDINAKTYANHSGCIYISATTLDSVSQAQTYRLPIATDPDSRFLVSEG